MSFSLAHALTHKPNPPSNPGERGEEQVREHCCPQHQNRPAQTWVASPLAETVARMDAGPKPTWRYLRRVSAKGLAIHVGLAADNPV